MIDRPIRPVDPTDADWPRRWEQAYNDAFTTPPWTDPERTGGALTEQVRPARSVDTWRGFEVVDDGRVVAGTCGWRAPGGVPAGGVEPALRSAMGVDRWAEFTQRRPFLVAELFVASGARGRDLGRRLLAAVQPVGLCWLATPTAMPAAAMYGHLGYDRVCEVTTAAGAALTVFTIEVT